MDGWIGPIDSVIGVGHQQPILPRYDPLVLRAGLRKDRPFPYAIDVLEYRNSAWALMFRRVAGGLGWRAGLLLLRCYDIGYVAIPRPGIDLMDSPVRAVEMNHVPWPRRIGAGVKPRHTERRSGMKPRYER